MRLLIVSPAPSGSRVGNRITALRMAGLLRRAGHEVKLRGDYEELGADIVIALHAFKSAGAVERARAADSKRPIVVVLTGTDLYEDIAVQERARRALELADRLVILQPKATLQLPESVRDKTRLILQSASPPKNVARPDSQHFDLCVLAHMRPVKDPLLCARATRLLPADSRARVLHVGSALDETSRVEAESEVAANPRFQWLGSLGHERSLEVLASSRLLVLTSRNEGGPAAVTEAIACGVPVLSTRIPASEGLLGDDYPGFFPVGDAAALAQLISRCERDDKFLAQLRDRILTLAPSVRPEREARDLAQLIAELSTPS